MNIFTVRRVLLASVLALVVLGASWVTPLALSSLSAKQNGTGMIAMQRPSFLSMAHAEGNGANAFTDEAGISAYLNLGQAVNLSVVDDVCRTVEASTVDYFLCSVGVPDYPESEDAKVYVDKTGWVLAYYPRGEAAGKIFDWYHYDGGTSIPTKLEKAVSKVVAKAGSSALTPTYYHFAYPNANKMLLIAERVAYNTTDSFQVNIPGSFSYFERSWAHGRFNANAYESGGNLLLDGQEISHYDNKTKQGALTAVQLAPDNLHTIEGHSIYEPYNLALVLIYKVP